MATRDEAHSTRGRANVLRLAMTGRLGESMTDSAVHEALDLCLSCKACKTECPNGVDMSKLKAEVWQARHRRHGASLRDRMVAEAPRLAGLASGWRAGFANGVLSSAIGRRGLGRLGFAAERAFPEYARRTFVDWFRSRGPGFRGVRRVALFVDTYINHHEPDVGIAAVHALEACDVEVLLADVGCCQRPRLSKGFLDAARSDGASTLKGLEPYVRDDTPILVCEPSCASALVDDLPDLHDDRAMADALKRLVMPIEEFLDRHLDNGGRAGLRPRRSSPVHVHGHCHQKSLFDAAATGRVLERIGATVTDLDTGCCGMAGSFGYETEHHALSMAIGEDRLFPSLRALADADDVVACGFSCRHQIRDALGRRARHWVEIVEPVD